MEPICTGGYIANNDNYLDFMTTVIIPAWELATTFKALNTTYGTAFYREIESPRSLEFYNKACIT